jgi:hypothetical protein
LPARSEDAAARRLFRRNCTKVNITRSELRDLVPFHARTTAYRRNRPRGQATSRTNGTDAIIRKGTHGGSAATATADVVSRTRRGPQSAAGASNARHFTVTAIFTDGWMLHRIL